MNVERLSLRRQHAIIAAYRASIRRQSRAWEILTDLKEGILYAP